MKERSYQFTIAAQPELRVQDGAFGALSEVLASNGYVRPAIITGGRSVRGRDDWGRLLDTLAQSLPGFLEFTVRGEPSPEVVNAVVRDIIRDLPDCDVVVAVGGGSVLDAGKAIAAGTALVRDGIEAADSFDITRYLEGVGDRVPDGRTVPLIAFPTTAGTGSEATKNAVISRIGNDGFKKSLRHDRFVPRLAIIDPLLHIGCPDGVTRASGLDAITQLLEAYVSTKATPVTDALALLGLRSAGKAFPRLVDGEDGVQLRADMALAAYLSGVCLASAGLGVVHGFAAPVGALRDIPHGVVCGLLFGPVAEATLETERQPRRPDVVTRYRDAADALGFGGDTDRMLARVYSWAKPLGRLSDYGFTQDDLAGLAEATGLKNHPVDLDVTALGSILERVL